MLLNFLIRFDLLKLHFFLFQKTSFSDIPVQNNSIARSRNNIPLNLILLQIAKLIHYLLQIFLNRVLLSTIAGATDSASLSPFDIQNISCFCNISPIKVEPVFLLVFGGRINTFLLLSKTWLMTFPVTKINMLCAEPYMQQEPRYSRRIQTQTTAPTFTYICMNT